jgi:hypothetical protein
MNILIASHTGEKVGTKILVMKEHQIPLEPSIEGEIQVPKDVVSMFMQQEEHTVEPKQQGEIS